MTPKQSTDYHAAISALQATFVVLPLCYVSNLWMVSDILNSLWQHCIRDARHISRGVQVHYFCVSASWIRPKKFNKFFNAWKIIQLLMSIRSLSWGKAKMQCADITCNHQHTQKQWWSPYQLTFAHTSDDRNQPLINSYFLTTKKPEMRPAIYISIYILMTIMSPLFVFTCWHQWSLMWGLHQLFHLVTSMKPELSPS